MCVCVFVGWGWDSDHAALHYKEKETHSVIQTKAAAAVKQTEAETVPQTRCTTSDTFQPEGKNYNLTLRALESRIINVI